MLVGQEVGVDASGIDAVENPFPVGVHGEIAGRGRFRGKTRAVTDPLQVVGPGQIPADLEVVPVERFVVAGPGIPFLLQGGPFLEKLVTRPARQANPGRQGTGGIASRLLQRPCQRLFGG